MASNGVIQYQSEVHRFISIHLDDEKKLNESLFELLCCYVGNKIHEEGDVERRFDLLQTIAVSFNNLVRNFKLKDFMDQELFNYLPGNDWPQSFQGYITNIQNNEIPSTFYATKKEDLRRIAAFGHKIWGSFLEVKQIITNKYHPHWNEEENGVNTKEMLFKKIYDDLLEKADIGFDTAWLSFLLLGKPSSQPLECFNLVHSKQKFDLTAAIDEGKQYMKKSRRRESRNYSDIPNQPNSPEPNQPIQIILIKDEDTELITECEKYLIDLNETEGKEDEINRIK